jgi:hypothetical protein
MSQIFALARLCFPSRAKKFASGSGSYKAVKGDGNILAIRAMICLPNPTNVRLCAGVHHDFFKATTCLLSGQQHIVECVNEPWVIHNLFCLFWVRHNRLQYLEEQLTPW